MSNEVQKEPEEEKLCYTSRIRRAAASILNIAVSQDELLAMNLMQVSDTTNQQRRLLEIALASSDVKNILVCADHCEQYGDEHRATFLRLAAEEDSDTEAIFNWPIQYAMQQQYYKHYNKQFNWDMPPTPSFDECLTAFSEEKLEAIKYLHTPTLILIPPVDFASLTQTFNPSEEFGNVVRYDCYVNDHYTEHPHPTPKHWTPCIIEGVQEMPEPSLHILNQTIAKRLEQDHVHREMLNRHLEGIDRFSYASLMLLSLHQKKPVDKNTWTLLDADKSITNTHVPGASVGGGQTRFRWGIAAFRSERARLRSSVRGECIQD